MFDYLETPVKQIILTKKTNRRWNETILQIVLMFQLDIVCFHGAQIEVGNWKKKKKKKKKKEEEEEKEKEDEEEGQKNTGSFIRIECFLHSRHDC